MKLPQTFLGWAGLVFLLTIVAVAVMVAASIAFVFVAGVALLGSVIALVLLIATRGDDGD
ncbi:hypothetical protein [Henriciella litoralis]|uniref:hypothetical protein n=1 Tax=Henriciella litoralis TaxID=568102 RepID=UPI0009FF4C3D|nr:hypothetical protein [Henriciella litoralis]